MMPALIFLLLVTAQHPSAMPGMTVPPEVWARTPQPFTWMHVFRATDDREALETAWRLARERFDVTRGWREHAVTLTQVSPEVVQDICGDVPYARGKEAR